MPPRAKKTTVPETEAEVIEDAKITEPPKEEPKAPAKKAPVKKAAVKKAAPKAKPTPAAKPLAYVVQEGISGTIGGYPFKFFKGQVLFAHDHGLNGIEKLKNAGVQLVKQE